MPGMERFTQRARRVLSLAHQEAERARNNFIGTEHVLLGLLDEEGGVAGRVLRKLGMTPDRIREAVHRVSTASPDFDLNSVELASQTQQVLEFAVEEARRLAHNYIGTEHILLGLVRVEGTALDMLRRLGVNEDQIRRQTQQVLNETASASTTTAAAGASKLPKLNQVFIIHGQDEQKKMVASLVQVLGFVPVLLEEKNEGKTIIEYLDKHSNDVALVVVILTNSDPAVLPSGFDQPGWRVDHNYIYELGYFRGKLGRNRVCVLYPSDFQREIELVSAFTGVIYVPLDTAGTWMIQVAKTIQDTELK